MEQAMTDGVTGSGDNGYRPADPDEDDVIPDPIDARTGESFTSEGTVPPRPDDLSTMSYRSLPDEYLWNEIARIRPVAVVALKHPDATRGSFRGRTLLTREDFSWAVEQLARLDGVRLVEDGENGIIIPTMLDGERYPTVHVELSGAQALSTLRTLTVVDYVEPLFFLDGIGCSVPAYLTNGADESFTPAPGSQQADRVSWNFRHMGIQDAWRLFNNGFGIIVAPGKGKMIGVIDTGLYPDAPQFDATFQLPPGTRGPVHRMSARVDPTVYCSHGTRIAGVAAAPAAGRPSPGADYVGVAWGSDLVAVKVGNGVVQTDTTVNAVVAGMEMAITAGARVLTLAFGMPYASDYLRDNIVRIFDDQTRPSVLLVAAAGTNVPWVVFPASMERETVAVTIVDFKPNATSRYQKYAGISYFPDIVAYGPAVDFAAVNGPGDIPTQGNTATPLTTIGGSSSATALIAGIAAVAWSRIPQLSRSDLVGRLAAASSLVGIEGQAGVVGRSSDVGWGIPDAYVVAGGARRAAIQGPQTVMPGDTYQLTASADGYQPFFTYRWDTGETTQTITSTADGPGKSRNHSVVVRNMHDQSTLQASTTVIFSGAHLRTVYSDELVSEWATFFNGARVDRPVNVGQELPVGCSVVWVRGLEYVSQNGALVPSGSVVESKDNGNNGFTVLRSGGLGPRALDAVAHVWHDGLSAIRMRVAYRVWEPDSVDCVQPGVTIATP
jgi:hypothetical protein